MRRGKVFMGVAAIALSTAIAAAVARADGPEVGMNVGAMVPLAGYRQTVKKNVGGTVGLSGGYRFDLADHVALSLIGQPQFTFADTEECCGTTGGDDVSSMFIITGGPKLSLMDDQLETYVAAQGGYYRDMSGLLDDDGPGFNVGGGINYRLTREASVGLYGRYDHTWLDAKPGSNDDRQFLLAGFAAEYVFLPPEAPKAEAPPPRPAPAPAPPPARKIVLRGVNFDFDKANIRKDARPILDEAIRTLKGESRIDISVEGHTDAIGTDGYNQRLSERRANSVADYLSTGGIARSRMSTVGFGESKPVATNATEDGRAQNRRVELRIVNE